MGWKHSPVFALSEVFAHSGSLMHSARFSHRSLVQDGIWREAEAYDLGFRIELLVTSHS